MVESYLKNNAVSFKQCKLERSVNPDPSGVQGPGYRGQSEGGEVKGIRSKGQGAGDRIS